MKFNKNTFEIIFFARGGQGAKTAVEVLAQAALREKKFVQAFPYFGPERSGAPVRAYFKISDNEILTHEPIVDPDAVVVLDENILDSHDVAKNLDEYESLIINSARHALELADKIPRFKGKIYPIDATELSLRFIGQNRPNTVILGKLIQITEVVRLENAIEAFQEMFAGKIGKENTEKNLKAIREAYDTI